MGVAPFGVNLLRGVCQGWFGMAQLENTSLFPGACQKFSERRNNQLTMVAQGPNHFAELVSRYRNDL
jgi:hypothetical protein